MFFFIIKLICFSVPVFKFVKLDFFINYTFFGLFNNLYLPIMQIKSHIKVCFSAIPTCTFDIALSLYPQKQFYWQFK